MAIRDIPDQYADLERFNEEYERARFRRTEATKHVGRATRDMFLSWFPGLPQRFGSRAIYALMDERLLDAFGFPHPPHAVRTAVETSLRARGRLVAQLPARRSPHHRTLRRTKAYGREWRLEELGPNLDTS